MSARFESILYQQPASVVDVDEPEFFADLHLDQVRASITAGREDYQLEPFLHAPLREVDGVAYRHEIFRDLDGEAVRSAVIAFGEEMRRTRSYVTLARKQHYRYEKDRPPLRSPRGRQLPARRLAPRRACARAGRGRWVDGRHASPQSRTATRFPGLATARRGGRWTLGGRRSHDASRRGPAEGAD